MEGEWEEAAQCDVTGRMLGYGDWYTKVGAQRDLCGAEWRELPAHERRRYARIDGPGDLDRADAMTAAELARRPMTRKRRARGMKRRAGGRRRWAQAKIPVSVRRPESADGTHPSLAQPSERHAGTAPLARR